MQTRTITSASTPPAAVAGRGGSIALGLFGSVFALVGVLALIAGMRGMASAQQNAWVGVLVGAIFTLVGSLIIYAAAFSSRAQRSENTLQAQFPREPWKWNKAWRDGKISDDSESSLAMMWIFAMLWNSIGVPSFIIALVKGDAGKAIWLIALFPLVGLGLVSAAFYITAQRWKYGRCNLDLETFPGRIGGWIGGTIATATVIDCSAGVQVMLKCINRVTTGGSEPHTNEFVLWQQQQTLIGKLPRAGSGLGFPFAFQIPGNCSPTRDDSNNAIVWRIVATASEPGIDFKTTFTVPVFAVEGSADAVPAAEALAAKFRAPESTRPHDGSIGFEKDTAGREYFEFPPGRNPSAALTLTLFALIFGGVGAGVWYGAHLLVFAVPFTLVGGLFGVGATVSLLRSRTIRVLQDVVELRWSMLGLGRTRVLPRRSITAVKYKSNMTSGNTSYFQVLLVSSPDEIVAASGLLTDDAKWIAEELGKTLGVSSSGESSVDMQRFRR